VIAHDHDDDLLDCATCSEESMTDDETDRGF
jgi:hypothetical protein